MNYSACWLIAGVISTLGCGATLAADRVAIIGTSISLVIPDGFVDQSASPGLVAGGNAARISAAELPGSMAAVFDQVAAHPEKLSELAGKMDFMPGATGDVVELGGRKFLVFEGVAPLAIRSPQWLVYSWPEPTLGLNFIQTPFHGVAPLLDRGAVLAVLASLKSQPTAKTEDGAVSLGLALTAAPPFADVFVNAADHGITLWAPQTHAGAPILKLIFPVAGEYRTLRDRAATYVTFDDPAAVSDADFAGATGLRFEGHYKQDEADYVAVEYVANVAGQPLVLIASGSANDMTAETIAAIDQIAGSVQRQMPE